MSKLINLSDLELSNGRHYTLFHAKRQLSEPTAKKFTEARPKLFKRSVKEVSFSKFVKYT